MAWVSLAFRVGAGGGRDKEPGSSTFIYDEKKFGPETTIIYRQYATLYFVFCVDKSESELGILDLIQVGGEGERGGERERACACVWICITRMRRAGLRRVAE